MKHVYEIYGYSVASELEIPEAMMAPSRKNGTDIRIVLGDVPKLAETGYPPRLLEIQNDGILLNLPGIARYRLEDDGRITIQLEPGSEVRMVRTFLLGMVMAVYVYRKGALPLHVSAVSTPDGIIAFSGASGAGKSTTAASIHAKKGWPILCDDVAVASVSAGRVRLTCGLNRLKLWRQKIEMLGMEKAEMEPDFFRTDKFHLISPQLFDHSAADLSTLVLLTSGDVPKRLLGVEKFLGVLESIYRPEVAKAVADPTAITQACAEVANAIEVRRIDGSRILENNSNAVDSFIEECLISGA